MHYIITYEIDERKENLIIFLDPENKSPDILAVNLDTLQHFTMTKKSLLFYIYEGVVNGVYADKVRANMFMYLLTNYCNLL